MDSDKSSQGYLFLKMAEYCSRDISADLNAFYYANIKDFPM
jgi:hypothetical protein